MKDRQEWIISLTVRFDEPVGAADFSYALRRIAQGLVTQYGEGISNPESEVGITRIMLTADTGEGIQIGGGFGSERIDDEDAA